jgi:hypothetical protein
MASRDDKKPPTIEDLYPDLSPEDQEEAERNLKAYAALVWRIYNRHKQEGTLDDFIKEARKYNKQQEKAANKAKKKPKAKAV